MPDKKFTEMSLTEFQSLDPKVIAELQQKYGMDVAIRSNHEAINKILATLGRPGLVGAESVFERGFDRTSPGYDKYYNRDIARVDRGELVTNPAEPMNMSTEHLKGMTLADAIKTLSIDQLSALKKLHG